MEPQGIDQKVLYTLSNIASNTNSWKILFDKVFIQAREHFIFDNLVVFGPGVDPNPPEVLYARAVGRGKTAEADVAWGTSITTRVLNEKKVIVETPQDLNQTDRLKLPYILGLPVYVAPTVIAVIVFIRFGGPAYLEDQIDFAQFLATVVASILRQKQLVEYEESLENERSTSKLQFDFVNTISHELRNPLGFIRGYTTTLLRDDAKWDQSTQIDFLQIIERETNNLTELIDALLDSSRLQSGQMKFNFQIVRIDSLLRDEINRALIADPGQSIELICESEAPTVIGDARRLAQVFDNLLSNGHKYAPQTPIKVTVSDNQELITIRFTDFGSGIPAIYLPKIFTRFFRVPDNSLQVHGSGLGLSICKQIIELHNGDISVESNEKGTTFIINLPINNDVQASYGETT